MRCVFFVPSHSFSLLTFCHAYAPRAIRIRCTPWSNNSRRTTLVEQFSSNIARPPSLVDHLPSTNSLVSLKHLPFANWLPSPAQAALLQRWVLPHIMCSFCSFIQIVSVNVSVGTLSAIAADRYLVVFYPIKYRIKKRSAKFIIVFIWFFSVLAAVPALIALRVVYIPDLMNVTINQELSSALCELANFFFLENWKTNEFLRSVAWIMNIFKI